jgi:hypothetical protein
MQDEKDKKPPESLEEYFEQNPLTVSRQDVTPWKKSVEEEDEITMARSIVDEIIEETESESGGR